MFAGAPLSYWIGFHLLVVFLLCMDLFVLQRRGHAMSPRLAWGWTAVLAALAGLFALGVGWTKGHQAALEFTSGYLIESSLSVDNLFVFLLLFRSLRLSERDQHRALEWGILGAIVMRAFFIAVGVSLLQRFAWVEYVFGAFLLVAAVRLMRHSSGTEEPTGPVAWLQKRLQQQEAAGVEGNPGFSPSGMLLVIAAVELTDLVFALDSIPAVLAITRDPFIVYTSNIFAILGLRSLFFALSAMLSKLRLLHYGLAVILAFVALKMLLGHWVVIPVTVSLGVIFAILAIFVAASLLIPAPAVEPDRN